SKSFPVKSSYSKKEIKKRLARQVRSWKGVPYKYGGLSKKGVDCSGFVSITFKEQLGIALPRSTKLMSRIGKKIKKKHLRSGDLVFFDTGRYNHVGIYVSDGSFIHASSSKGVTTSRLSNSYWKKHYWKSIRVIKN
ncbi:MAG: C40 family peptidase, partial [Deltaproteobacteria bacterium]|nr:C40 family peptidase [Deltaproteobacteria bacterium]